MANNERVFTRDQKRAQFAWEFVENKLGKLGPKDFATACKKASTRIMNAGLAGALAFGLSKVGKREKTEELKYDRTTEAIAAFMTEGKKDGRAYLEELIAQDASMLRSQTEEVMALLQWLARLADGKAAAIGDQGSEAE
jgi:CRISPR type III-B/RAMP module-associated protein Cmr5